MDNKKIGIILICVSLIFLVLLGFIRINIIKAYQAEIDKYVEAGQACPSDPNICPHEQKSKAQTPIFIAGILLIGVISFGIYLIFFEKSQKILKENQEKLFEKIDEDKEKEFKEKKFDILLKGLDNDEKEIIKAVREQDGISQSTLSLRTNIHKSKLSIILNNLEKKNLIKKVSKGKLNYIHLKIGL